MSGLTHSPARVLRQLMVDLGLATNPPNISWPIYFDFEPSTPDQLITSYDTVGRLDGRSMADGQYFEHYGWQLRIRSTTAESGYVKANAITEKLDKEVYDDTVRVEQVTYLVHAVYRTSPIIRLGKESETSKRNLFTINGLITLRQL